MKRILLLIIFLIFFVEILNAQHLLKKQFSNKLKIEYKLTFSCGGVGFYNKTGFLFGIGQIIFVKKLFILASINYLEANFLSKNIPHDPRYYTDYFKNGQSR